MFKAKLRKIGNSVGILIPHEVIMGRQVGEMISLEVMGESDREVITKEMDFGETGETRDYYDNVGNDTRQDTSAKNRMDSP